MDIVVNEELKAYIDPLTEEAHDALERSLLAAGCRDALVLWGDVLVDGHNRFSICRREGGVKVECVMGTSQSATGHSPLVRKAPNQWLVASGERNQTQNQSTLACARPTLTLRSFAYPRRIGSG